MLKKIHFA
jgi:hypothetical protein